MNWLYSCSEISTLNFEGPLPGLRLQALDSMSRAQSPQKPHTRPGWAGLNLGQVWQGSGLEAWPSTSLDVATLGATLGAGELEDRSLLVAAIREDKRKRAYSDRPRVP